MVYDAARSEIVLFGGLQSGNVFLADTWTWDGISWALASQDGPEPRAGASMAYDPTRDSTILFGGLDSDTDELGDTWQPTFGQQSLAHIGAREQKRQLGRHKRVAPYLVDDGRDGITDSIAHHLLHQGDDVFGLQGSQSELVYRVVAPLVGKELAQRMIRVNIF